MPKHNWKSFSTSCTSTTKRQPEPPSNRSPAGSALPQKHETRPPAARVSPHGANESPQSSSFRSCLLYATRQPEVEWFEKQVPYGEIASLTLPDGTHLHLNSGSRITYPSAFTGKERRIFVDGEIFADVAKDPHKPFIIRSGDVGIRVLGTKFNFKSYTNTDCIELLLVDGAVQFDIDTDTRKQQLRMEPGDLVLYDRVSNDINLSTFQPEHFKSFADNRAIHFFNLRMHDIALDLERLFGTRIVILDEALAQTRYFAYFTNNETLDQILSAINSDRKMKISRRDGVVYLSLK